MAGSTVVSKESLWAVMMAIWKGEKGSMMADRLVVMMAGLLEHRQVERKVVCLVDKLVEK